MLTKYAGILSVLLIAIVGFAVYANTLNGDFVCDDNYFVKHNKNIQGWSGLRDIFNAEVSGGTDMNHAFYRPLQIFTYMADYSVWGLNSKGYHITNIVLHILTALAVYALIRILSGNLFISLAAGLLFSVHPAHVAVVSYIAGRADSLALLFMLLCLIFYARQVERPTLIGYIFLVLCYVLALLAKENAMIFPALLLVFHYALPATGKKRRMINASFISILAVACLYIIFRALILPLPPPHLLSRTTAIGRLPGFFVALVSYLRILFFPIDLHMEYGYKIFSYTDPRVISGILITIVLLACAFIKIKANRLISFSIIWFLIALLPVSNIYPIPIAYMAEHWLYVPSIGFFLLLAIALNSLYRKGKVFKRAAAAILCVLICYYSFITVSYNRYWKDPVLFYKRMLRYNPNNLRFLGGLANVYFNRGNIRATLFLYEKCLSIDPNFAKLFLDKGAAIYTTLGNVYNVGGRTGKAIDFYKKAIGADPSYAKAYNNLGSAYLDIGNNEDALAVLKKAVELEPNFAIAYSNLGRAYLKAGRKDDAEASYKKAVETDPAYAVSYYNLSSLYLDEGKYDLAVRFYDEAVQHGHKSPRVFSDNIEAHRKK